MRALSAWACACLLLAAPALAGDLPLRPGQSRWWNAMAPGDVLSVGRELVVWTKAPAQIATAATGSGAATTATAQASLVRSDSSAGFAGGNRIREITYVVRRGDSLSSIARRFRVTVDKLVEWNRGAGDKYLQPGQRLKMVVDVTEQSGG